MAERDDLARGASVTVWLFHGSEARFASWVFANETDALSWAAAHQLTGVLSEYPLGSGAYDDALERGRFTPSKPHHGSSTHVASFSPAYRHLHITEGHPDS